MNLFDLFAQPLLLGGLLLVALPVAIHMMMRQKPKRLMFPAMRFLMQRSRTNQRKMRLRHLLLLSLRMLLIALVCLALAGPRVEGNRLNLAGERPRAVVLVIDTSPSMEYKVAGKSRLDEARRLALELIDELPANSRVAVMDTASSAGDWEGVGPARAHVAGLQTRPDCRPVTSLLAHAYDLFGRLKREGQSARDAPQALLFVFSDRTEAAWDRGQTDVLKRMRDRTPDAVAGAFFVDVGVDKPEDIAVTDLRLERAALAPGETARIHAVVRATGRAADLALVCQVDGDVIDRKPVQLEDGQALDVVFEHVSANSGPHHVRVTLEVNDAALSVNDERFATFVVRGGRRVLTVTDDPQKTKDWDRAVTACRFKSEVMSVADAAELTPQNLAVYHAVCLVHVTPKGGALHELWSKLKIYVQGGGGLAVVPGGADMDTDDGRKAYNEEPAAQFLLPGTLKSVEAQKAGATLDWERAKYQHVIFAPFPAWFAKGFLSDYPNPNLGPRAFRFWQVEPTPGRSDILIPYAVKGRPPALVERVFDGKEKVRGRSLLFTVPMDDRNDGTEKRAARWHDYLEAEPSFYFVLTRQVLSYLAGDDREENFTYQCGQNVTLAVPASPRHSTYTIQGPGLHGADAVVSRPEGENELSVSGTKAYQRGNYTLFSPDAQRVAGFSLNDAGEESQLAPRVPADQIGALFGDGSVLEMDYRSGMREALENRVGRRTELFPLLMIVLLVVLAVENLLSNKFYRRDAQEEQAPKPPEAAPAEKREEVAATK